ncbi:MAG: hypothetical protein Q9M48_15920 [Rhodobacterales bacterium]|nr:hypothetical protein [Rhodobacterales bacterium]
MTAISEQFESTADFSGIANRQQLRGASRVLSRAMFSFFGATLMASAVGLWLVPSDYMDAEMMLIRLVLSLIMFGAGAVLLQNGRDRTAVEIEVDPKRSELRLIERGEDGIARLTQVIGYKDIGHADMRDGVMTLIDHDNALVLKLPLGQVENLADIEAAIAPMMAEAA